MATVAAKLPNQFENGKIVEYLRASPAAASPVGVDRENKVIRGVVVAQKGQFQDALGMPSSRGEFDDNSLKAGYKLLSAAGDDGMLSHYGHSAEHGSADELDRFLGRFKNPVIDGDKLRADLLLDPSAMLATDGGISRGEKLMARAESDPASFGASMIVNAAMSYRMDNHNKPRRDATGAILPPIWQPTHIAGIDIVSRGAATPDGLLSAADDALAVAAAALDKSFIGMDRGTICAFFNFYMASRFVCSYEPQLVVESECEDMAAKPEKVEPPQVDSELLRLRWNQQKRKAGIR